MMIHRLHTDYYRNIVLLLILNIIKSVRNYNNNLRFIRLEAIDKYIFNESLI